jgi:hypothetical protein
MNATLALTACTDAQNGLPVLPAVQILPAVIPAAEPS